MRSKAREQRRPRVRNRTAPTANSSIPSLPVAMRVRQRPAPDRRAPLPGFIPRFAHRAPGPGPQIGRREHAERQDQHQHAKEDNEDGLDLRTEVLQIDSTSRW